MANGLYKLKLAYKGSDYSRTVVVQKKFSLAFLHEVIQASFGWLNYHLYNFVDAKGAVYESDADAMDLPLDKGQKMLLAAEVAIGKVLKKAGDKLDYMYDFGDGNEIEVSCLGTTSDFAVEDFASIGPDLVEDSAGFGFTPGIVKLLAKKGKKSAKAAECEAWLAAAFGKAPSAVLREPSADEIHARVWHLHELVCTALPAK